MEWFLLSYGQELTRLSEALESCQQQGLRLFHRRYRLPCDAQFQQAKELLVGLVEVGDPAPLAMSYPRGRMGATMRCLLGTTAGWLQVSELDSP